MSAALRVEDGGLVFDQIDRQAWWERVVLGTMLKSPALWRARLSDLRATDFISPGHAEMFGAMLEMRDASEPADPVLLLDRMIESGLGAAFDLAGIFELILAETWAVENAEAYACKLREIGHVRESRAAAATIARAADDSALGDEERSRVIVEATKAMRPRFAASTHARPASAAAALLLTELEDFIESGVQPPGISTGFSDLDAKLGPIEPASVNVIAARTSVGKTAFAASIARHLIETGTRTLYCSLEMPSRNLARRFLMMRSGISRRTFRDIDAARMYYPDISEALSELYDLPLMIDDRASQSVEDIRREVDRIDDLGCVIVDYVQIMGGAERAENANHRIAAFMVGLREIAKERNVPIFALAQLNRQLERREEKRPNLSDLRDSGALEAEANAVLLLYRPEYHQRLANPAKYRSVPTEPCEVVIAKNRDEGTGIAVVAFEPQYARFVSADSQSVAAYWRSLEDK